VVDRTTERKKKVMVYHNKLGESVSGAGVVVNGITERKKKWHGISQ
jgi:hypothetical protein